MPTRQNNGWLYDRGDKFSSILFNGHDVTAFKPISVFHDDNGFGWVLTEELLPIEIGGSTWLDQIVDRNTAKGMRGDRSRWPLGVYNFVYRGEIKIIP